MKQRILSTLLALAMLLTLVPTVAFAAGTEANPYVINSADDWVNMFNTYYGVLNDYYCKLGSDIDLTGKTWSSKNFQNSVLDGDGHSISNIEQPLFPGLINSTIKNLAIVGANITDQTGSNIGILTKSTSGTKTTIQNCYVSGKVTGSYLGVGGLIGSVGNTTEISNCAVDVTVKNTRTGNYNYGAGGLIGYVSESNYLTISHCYATGTVTTGAKFAGGLVGAPRTSGTIVKIDHSVALQNQVSGVSSYYAGRIAGSSVASGNFNTTYFSNNYGYTDMKSNSTTDTTYTADEGNSVNGANVSKTDCTTENFWKNTMGFSESVWTLEDGKLPHLKKLSSMTGNPPTYLLDAASCPVALGTDTTVAVSFLSTDDKTVTKEDGITISPKKGSPELKAEDFKFSSSDSALVTIDGLSVTDLTDNTLTVSMAKSVTNTTAYLFYNSYCLGEITLTKRVNKVPLAAPTEAKWDNAKATWSAVTNATKYSVQLYKGDEAQGAAVTTKETSHDFTSAISESGDYTFQVKAIGDSTYADSEEAISTTTYKFTQQTLTNLKQSAEDALREMQVSNDTTADDVMEVVTDRITNKSITADWSAEKGFNLARASDGENNGTDGKITGTIVLTLGEETESIEVNLTIKPKFSVTFVGGAADSGTPPTQANVTAGTEINLPENTFTYYGKKFTGWKVGESIYQPNATYTMPSGNVTFTAQWENDVWNGTDKSDSLKGSGKENDPYIIASGADLNYLVKTMGTTYCSNYYKLMADIDMGDHAMAPIHHLDGTFDGNGHKITNLQVTSENGNVYYGLFYEAGNANSGTAVIKDLTLDASLTYPNNTGDGILGLLVCQASNKLTIENCYVTGTINAGEDDNMRVGSLVGKATGSDVKISKCYAGVTFTGGTSKSSFSGLVGNGENITIENSYATPDMTGVTAGIRSGIAKGNDGKSVTIKNCYAAGTNFNGAGIASSTATVSNSVSIFPEMKGSARIGVNGTNNYGFAGTVQRDKDDAIITPSDLTIQGTDATADQLTNFDFYKDTLHWDETVWEIRDGYAFPVLKAQKTTPTLNLDLDPSVVSVKLDKTTATLPCGGTLQLKATVDVKNGADRTVVWNSSDPTKAVVDGSGKVTVRPDATSGEVKITATAAADGTKMATATVMADANSYELTATKDPTNKLNSPNANYKFYSNEECTEEVVGPVQAGETVYIKITNMSEEDIVNEVKVPGANKVTRLNNSTYYFDMPCEDTEVIFFCAVWMNPTNYVWFVGSDWGTWGETVTYTTTKWNGTDHIGSLTIDNIINGKQFDSFEVKSMTACDKTQKKESGVKLTEKFQYKDLQTAGDYFVDKTTNSAHPVLYVYNDKPGTVIVNINVKDDPNAIYNITQDPDSSSYYTLSTYKAKVGDPVTATLTDAGIKKMNSSPKQSMTLTYDGGLLVVMFPGQFQPDKDGNWTVSFKMPAQDITTYAYVSEKQEVKLTSGGKTVKYNGQPQTIDSAITAMLGEQNVSEAMMGHYTITYNGDTTPPTNVGVYNCTVKISEGDPLYYSDTLPVTLTIEKATPTAPNPPAKKSVTYNSVTLNPPAGSEGFTLQYKCGDGEWQDSPTFTGLLPGTSYQFYARIKEDKNTEASASSTALPIETPPYTPSVPEGETTYKLEIKAVSDQDALKNKVTEANSKITASNVVAYSVTLWSKTGESNWTEVQDFPAGGITATLPYPAGSGMSGYTFVVMQGPAASATALSVSQKTAEGLQVKLTSLEAIAVGYCTASSGSHGNHGNGGTTTKFPFTDVAQGSYYYDAVAWAVDRGITSGTSATTFSPDAICTRAQAVTFLWRAMGSPQPTQTENPFTDVSPSAYYYQAILWAVEQGITNGTSATTFSPDLTVTRAHTVTFLWRLAGRPAADEALAFTDVEPGSYYETAVRWAIQKQITNGTSAATFSPDLGCTRAQMVTFLYRDLAAQ